MIKNNWRIYIAFFTLLLAGFFWAIYDERPFHESKLKVINASIPDFTFINQDRKTITQKNT